MRSVLAVLAGGLTSVGWLWASFMLMDSRAFPCHQLECVMWMVYFVLLPLTAIPASIVAASIARARVIPVATVAAIPAFALIFDRSAAYLASVGLGFLGVMLVSVVVMVRRRSRARAVAA